MPELPEVETTRRGLLPHMEGIRIVRAVVRHRQMRQPVPPVLPDCLVELTIRTVLRRAKYLLIDCTTGTLIIHLGMSGRLWLVNGGTAPEKHDHFDLHLANDKIIRLRDPRRFGLVLWVTDNPFLHPLLNRLGPEPLSDDFNAPYLFRQTRSRSSAIKIVIMDSHLVVGVGNIYASEALFHAGISPRKSARRLSLARCAELVQSISQVLQQAIQAGGSSIRDYVNSDGMAGNFQSQFFVYGRAGEPCKKCQTPIKHLVQGQRATYYCPICQR